MGKVITLGEIMLRLSTEIGVRLKCTSQLAVHYGGAEANVAISLAHYQHEVAFVSKVPDSSLGEAVIAHLRGANVSCEHLLKGGSRLGTYYLETGSGKRSAKVIYDRAASSFASMKENEWSDDLFYGAELFHISGITPALSEKWQALTLSLIKEAKHAGCKISFDVNYRGNLWTQQAAGEFLNKILPLVDYCSAGELDARHLLKIPTYQGEKSALIYYYQEIQARYPNIQVLYSTKRLVKSASDNHLVGTLWVNGKYFESKSHHICPIVDRIGAGDTFSAGILHGLLADETSQWTIDFATAAAALKHTVLGDDNQFNEEEVLSFLNDSGKIIR
ncbi:MAG: sugar kinase [Streptococcaceae bacterium]|jgi:2-dehydro-3-deoxygluconokinase|nr:sugar kinase [Streptococcaceae bacterium]